MVEITELSDAPPEPQLEERPAATLVKLFDGQTLPPLADPVVEVTRKLHDRRDQGTSLVAHSLLAALSDEHLAGIRAAALQVGVERARYAIGAVLGLAVGDCMGASLEFLPATDEPGESRWDHESFRVLNPNTHEKERGLLTHGQFTDDTSMALCLADSLIACDGLDCSDLRKRFWAWHAEGYNNCFRFDSGRAKRTSFGLGYNIAKSLLALEPNVAPTPAYESQGSNDSGNGALMRLAPLPVYYSSHRVDVAEEAAAASAAATHPGALAALTAAFLAFALHRAINLPAEERRCGARAFVLGVADEYAARLRRARRARARATPTTASGTASALGTALGSADDVDLVVSLLRCTAANCVETEAAWDWRSATSPPIVATLEARGEKYNGHPVSRAYYGSYCMDCLALALFAVASTSSFEAAVGRAVNFLGDADTVGAVAGQIAGAFYGETEIDPRHLAALRKFERGEICGRACLCFLLGRQQAIRDGRRDGRLLPRVTGGSVAAWLVGLPQHRRLLLSRLLGAALVGLFAVAAAVLFERKKWQY